MENKAGNRKKPRDTWKRRGLFALISNRPDFPGPGSAAPLPPPDAGEDDPFREEDDP